MSTSGNGFVLVLTKFSEFVICVGMAEMYYCCTCALVQLFLAFQVEQPIKSETSHRIIFRATIGDEKKVK